MNNRVKYGLPGLTGAFTLASGVTGWYCHSDLFALVLLVLVSTAVFSTFLIVIDD